MKLTMFGIPNCNTIKKAKDWLKGQEIAFDFHNYKKDGIDETTIQAWVKHVGWKVLLNTKGTTWKKLSAEDKTGINEARAIALMATYPSMIKRPVLLNLDNPSVILVGFDETACDSFFASQK